VPFTICTSDGQKHYVAHPDFIAIGGEKDEVIIVFKEAGGFSFIDIFNITSLEVVKKSA